MIAGQYQIRPARAEDVPALPAIEREAARLFTPYAKDLGLHDDFPIQSLEDHCAAQRDGRLWVAVDLNDRPVGFAFVMDLGGQAHLDELDVLPSHGRRGVGGALIEAVCAWARSQGRSSLTLSTF